MRGLGRRSESRAKRRPWYADAMKRPAPLAAVVGPLFVLAACLAGCGGKEPIAPAAADTATTPASSVSAAPAAEASAAPTPEPRKRKPFEIRSACADPVTVVFGEDPKARNAGKQTLAPSATIEGQRNPDGNQTVWLLDVNEEPLVKVNVTRGMKRVEIGRSCRTLDAR